MVAQIWYYFLFPLFIYLVCELSIHCALKLDQKKHIVFAPAVGNGQHLPISLPVFSSTLSQDDIHHSYQLSKVLSQAGFPHFPIKSSLMIRFPAFEEQRLENCVQNKI